MQKWLVDLRLTSLSRLWWGFAVLCVLVLFLSSILFGTMSVVVLCIAGGIVYSYMCFLCYHPNAKKWRETLDSYYEMLFVNAFGYVHLPTPGSSVTTKTKPVTKREQTAPLQNASQGEVPASSSINTQKPHNGNSRAQPSKLCHREAQKIIQLIMRDFVHQWYGDVTKDLEFPDDVQKLLEHVALETNIRLQEINLEETVSEIAALVIPYLEVVNETGMRKYNDIEIFDVNHEKCLRAFESNHAVAHRALSSRDLELCYYRQALDALLKCAFPDKYQNCDLACMFVRELLLKNIIEPLFDLLCDPDFLLRSIPVILKKATVEKVERELAEIRQENEELERRLSHGRLILKIKGSPKSQRRRFQSLSGRFGGSEHQSVPSSPEFQHISPKHLRKQCFTKQRPKSVAAVPTRSSWACSTGSFETPLRTASLAFPSDDPTLQLGIEPEAATPVLVATATDTLYRNDTDTRRSFSSQSINRSSTLTPSDQVRGNERPLWETEEEGGRHRHNSNGEESTWDLIDIPRGPIYVDRHVRVVSGNSSHTAYIFKFPKRLLGEAELRDLGISEGDTHLEGMKRYREFDRFHTTLQRSPLAVHVKGLALPSKLGFNKFVSKLSLSSSDPDPVVLQERLQGLEKYLQSVSAVSTIAESPQFHQFLISGVQSFSQANIVDPRQKAARKKTFLGMMKGSSLPSFKETTQKAEPIPSHPIETVLSAYLDTHLPLPSHDLHSLHHIKLNTSKSVPSQTSTLPSTQHRRATLVGEPAPLNTGNANDSPVSSIASVGSVDSRGVPIADLAATPKASEFLSFVKDSRKNYSATSSPQLSKATTGGTDTPDTGTDTEHSSITGLTRTVSFNIPLDDEEGQTVGSSTSLSSSSSVSEQSYKGKPEGHDVLRNRHPKIKAKTSSVHSQIASTESVPKTLSRFSRLKNNLLNFFSHLFCYLALFYEVIKKAFDPITPETASSLAKEHSKRIPLTNAILGLGCEASKRHCPELWVCGQNTQLAVLVLAGGGMERFMWKELKEVVYSEENWSRALYHLRHTLWPNGKFMTETRLKPSEIERRKMRKEAVECIKTFLPNFLPVIIGPADYDNAAHHVLDCLQNPKITRYFLLRIVEVFLLKLIPELDSKDFQRQLAQIRTLTPPRNRFNNTGQPTHQRGTARS